jgi:hypothetical protein
LLGKDGEDLFEAFVAAALGKGPPDQAAQNSQ